jgi:hypothetical protein
MPDDEQKPIERVVIVDTPSALELLNLGGTGRHVIKAFRITESAVTVTYGDKDDQ